MNSAIEIRRPAPTLKKLLTNVYNQYQKLDDPIENSKSRQNFVFHMTDWIKDLEQMADLYRNPEKAHKDVAGNTVFGFLIHALPHLMEAGRLLEGQKIRNPFLEMAKKA